MPQEIARLLDTRRVLLCVGCGGVGKTTTCAALGLGAARRGKRVLCLTIDPAKRLAESLGLSSVHSEPARIAPELLAEAGAPAGASLTVMMLDTKTTFDQLVESLARSPDKRDAILSNVLYQYISTKLAGTQEYMAMEKLYAVKDDPGYDLVLLDTPPTSHALDFLDAPARLVGAIDSPAVRWFLEAFGRSGTLSLSLLQRTAATVLRGIGRITGGAFLDQVAAFVSEMNDLFGGWRRRAEIIAEALRGPEVGYLLVTTPDPMAIGEVLFFAERLSSQGLRPCAYVVNRVHGLPAGVASEAELGAAIRERGLSLSAHGPAHAAEAARQERRLGELDRLHLMALESLPGGAAPIAVLPDFPKDIHDISRLGWVADVLLG